MKSRLVIAALVSAASLALPAFSQITISDFSTVAPGSLQLNGNASIAGSALRLTPATFSQAGSAFSTSSVTLAANVSFSSFFTFKISGSGGISDGDGTGADGLVFVVQTNANNVGGIGGGIGYLGVPNSLGVEFDTWDNGTGFGDPNGNHVNFDFGGTFSSSANAALIPTRMNNDSVWSAWVDYDGTTNMLELRLVESSLVRPASALLSANVNLAAVLGSVNAFVGFTSGTGAAYGNHDILSWEFRDTFSPIVTPPGAGGAVPEPSTYGLMGAAGLIAISLYRRTKAKAAV
ncbi:MAG TPA: PEP-CTERM sorting domain-containing protein [Opitutaceae bacterium]|nr:PEP-CTERM sorting domain-containing protein [Opitutaceae bacterium]